MPTKFPKTTLEEVEAYGRKWQPRLRLQDWDITYIVKRFSCDNTMGQCNAQLRRHAAVIQIAPNVVEMSHNLPVGQGPRKGREVESTVVHELIHVYEKPYYLHLQNEIWKDGKPEPLAWVLFQEYQELMIETFVRVLLEADAAGAWGTTQPSVPAAAPTASSSARTTTDSPDPTPTR